MKSKLVMAVTATVVLTACGWSLAEEPVKVFMRVKLDHAQDVLEGLAVEDYDLIAKNAEKLTLLSQESDWNVLQTAEYVRLSNDFRRATRALTKAAEEKNLDGATLAYVTVTLNCVECHKHVRDVGIGR